MASLVKYIVAGITAVLAWLVLPYILALCFAALCVCIGLAVGHYAASFIGDVPSLNLRERFTTLRARFATTPEAA